jgi:hypothetical protein
MLIAGPAHPTPNSNSIIETEILSDGKAVAAATVETTQQQWR